jgi:GntR family transcriptional repressor for pyruvate dehydrogenase complex
MIRIARNAPSGATPNAKASMSEAGGGRLANRVYGQVIELIIERNLQEGEKLPPEGELSERFGVSRPIVRQALAQLASDGLVVTKHGSGSFLRIRPAEHLTHYISGEALAPAIGIFVVRAVLEPAAAALAAQRRTAEQLSELEHHFEEIRQAAITRAPAQTSDHEFHRTIMRATNNPVFEETYAQLAPVIMDGMRAGLALSRATETPVVDVEEHAAILRAIRARDEKGAELAMRWHLWQSRQRLLSRSAGAPQPRG